MDWLNDSLPVAGIEKAVAEMAQRLMSGPLSFRSRFRGGIVSLDNLDDYRAWCRTVERIGTEPEAERRVFEIFEMEKTESRKDIRCP